MRATVCVLVAACFALASPALALDPSLADLPEIEVLRAQIEVQRTAIDAAQRAEALQRAYVKRLEKEIETLETKLAITERALKARPRPEPLAPTPEPQRGATP